MILNYAERATDALLLCRSHLRHALVGEKRSAVLQQIRDCQQAAEALRTELRLLEELSDPKGAKDAHA